MVTARQEPRLVLISVGSEDGCLTLEAPEMKKVCVPVKLPRKNPVLNCRYRRTSAWRSCGELCDFPGFRGFPCLTLSPFYKYSYLHATLFQDCSGFHFLMQELEGETSCHSGV